MEKFTKSQVEIIKLSDRIVEFLKSQRETQEDAEDAILAVLEEAYEVAQGEYPNQQAEL